MKIEAENQNGNISIKFDDDKEIILSSNQTKDLLVTLLQHTIDTLSKDKDNTRMQNDYLHYMEIFNYLIKNRFPYVYVRTLTGAYLSPEEIEQVGYSYEDNEDISDDLYITLSDFIKATGEHQEPIIQGFSKRMKKFIKNYASEVACEIFRSSKYMDVNRDLYTCTHLKLPPETGENWQEAYIEKVVKLFE